MAAALRDHTFQGVLIDLDGTLVDSAPAVQQFWTQYALRPAFLCQLTLHSLAADLGISPPTYTQQARGRRTIDTVRLFDPSKATWECAATLRNADQTDVTAREAALPAQFGTHCTAVPGAADLLRQLDGQGVPWAVVTSCTHGLLAAWLQQLDLPVPATAVAAEDVAAGKPDPACYVLARERVADREGLKVRTRAERRAWLVLEDSATGVKAGKTAGCAVLGVTTNSGAGELRAVGADFTVPDYRGLRVVRVEGKGEAGWRLVDGECERHYIV